MNLDFDYLYKVLRMLNDSFSNLAKVSAYANGSSILKKTPSQLQVLKELKLHTLLYGYR